LPQRNNSAAFWGSPAAMATSLARPHLIAQVVTQQAPHEQLRLDVGQFEPRTLQPRAPSVGFFRAVVINAALCRRYPVSCALQVDQSVLARFRERAFLSW